MQTHYVREANGETVAVYQNGSRQFVNLLAGSEMIGTWDGSQRRYFLKDHLGSVRTTVDQSGNVDGYDDYYPFGYVMEGRSSNSSNPTDNYKFIGEERDREAAYTYGVDYLNARTYDPVIGRFMQVDPLFDVPEQIGLSPYNYSWNTPINLSDPTGECPSCVRFLVKTVKGFWREVPRKKALQVRKKKVTVKVEGPGAKRAAKKLENDAFPQSGTKTKFDDGHTLKDGSKGLDHFQQTKRSIKGHTLIDSGKKLLGIILVALAESVPVHGGDLGEGSSLLTSIEIDGEVYVYNKHLTGEELDKEIARQQKLREEYRKLEKDEEEEDN